MAKKTLSAAALLLALGAPVAAQTLGELTAAMGAHNSAASIGTGSASTVRTVRDKISRATPKLPALPDDEAPGRARGAMRTARAGGSRSGWSSGSSKGGGGGGWASGGWGNGGSPRRKGGR